VNNPDERGVWGVWDQKTLSFSSDTKWESGESVSQQSVLPKKTEVEKANKIGNKNGATSDSPDSLLATAQARNPDSPFQNQLPGEKDLSATELRKMLEEYVELTSANIIKLWEKKGKPEVPLGPGVKIGNLETYLGQGIVDIDQLGALGEMVKEWKKKTTGAADSG